MKHVIAVIAYDPEAIEDGEWTITINELGKELLATLTDFELRVCATEIGIRTRRAFEMPPSPKNSLRIQMNASRFAR